MHILVCGGAGYIGSHFVRVAHQAGHSVTVLDNLSTGHRQAVADADFILGDVSDTVFMHDFLSNRGFDLIVHFCAFSLVGESMTAPHAYYRNNVAGTLSLLDAMLASGHDRLVFSSTAAVYGTPEMSSITEDHPTRPINPYGQTKLMVETLLQDYARAHGLYSVCLRYFNAAGAAPDGGLGEKHDPETHLIPNILKSVASGGSMDLKVFGTDYPTPDGSCVRDYIHVDDLADAHLLAGRYLSDNPGAHIFNLGNGRGFSVLEVIAAATRVTGSDIPYQVADRRPGDPPQLVADASSARAHLHWTPRYTDIDTIIASAWPWHRDGENFHRGD